MSYFDFRPASPLDEMMVERPDTPPPPTISSPWSLTTTSSRRESEGVAGSLPEFGERIPMTSTSVRSSPTSMTSATSRSSITFSPITTTTTTTSPLNIEKFSDKQIKNRSPTLAKKCRICFQTDIILPSNDEKNNNKSSSKHYRAGIITHLISLFFLRKRSSLKTPELEGDGFISPCACKGSMAWVHKVCLEEWRRKSARRDSYYRCEYCFASYHFKHTWLATLLNNVLSLTLLTIFISILALIIMVTVMGAMLTTRADFNTFMRGERDSLNPDGMKIASGDGFWSLDGNFSGPPTSSNSDNNRKWTDRSRWFNLSTTTTTAATRTGITRRRGKSNESQPAPSKTLVDNTETTSPGGNNRDIYDGMLTKTTNMFIRVTTRNNTVTDNTNQPSPHSTDSTENTKSSSSWQSQHHFHSAISYVNIAYWLTGHSLDELEEQQNDFLLAIMDMSAVKVWTAAIFLLSLMALIVHGSASSLLAASIMVTSTMGMLLSTCPLFRWCFPAPTLYGCYRFWGWMYSLVETTVDVIIKNFSSELENYSPSPSP